VELSDGNLALLYKVDGDAKLAVIQPDGTEVFGPQDISENTGDLALAALPGGGFAAAWVDDDIVVFGLYDDAGAGTTTDIHVDGAPRLHLAALAGGGVVLGHARDGLVSLEVRSDLTTVAFSAHYPTRDSGFRLVGLNGGGIGLLHSPPRSEHVEGHNVTYSVLAADATEVAGITLAADFAAEGALAVAPNGNVLIGFEYGGPEAMAYAVVDEAGAVVHPVTTLSVHSPDAAAAGVFGDGDFVFFSGEGDSSVLEMWTISSESGALLSPPVLVDSVPPNDGVRSVLTLGPSTVGLVEIDYRGTTITLTELSKGFLQLELIDDTEVQLHNFTPEALELSVIAHRVP
jgi:hypothetical protein